MKRFSLLKGVIEKRYNMREGEYYVATLDHPDLSGLFEVSHSERSVREKLKKEVEDMIRLGVHYKKMELLVITTASGVVIVLWPIEPGEWVYKVFKNGSPRGNVLVNCETREEALERVHEHARQSYGGIKDVASVRLY